MVTTWNTGSRTQVRQLTWMGMIRKDLRKHELDLSVDKNEWRFAIAEVHSKPGGEAET